MTTNDIKNLSIALEALSRIPNVSDFSTRIQGLLIEAINEAEEQSTYVPVHSRPPIPPPVATPKVPSRAYTTFPGAPLPPASAPYPYNPSGIPTDDDIPF